MIGLSSYLQVLFGSESPRSVCGIFAVIFEIVRCCQEPGNSFGVRFPWDSEIERNRGERYLTTLASTYVLRLSLSTWSISETPWD